jgi:hypothetical protein
MHDRAGRPAHTGMRPAIGLAALLSAVIAGTGTAGAAPGPPRWNQQVLTVRESQHVVSWSAELRSCLLSRHLDVGRLLVSRTQVQIPVMHGAWRTILRNLLACAEPLGGPPARSSVQAFADKVVVYLPKRCLLDKKVAGRP